MSLFSIYLLTRFTTFGEYFLFLSLLSFGFTTMCFIYMIYKCVDSAYSKEDKAEKTGTIKACFKYFKTCLTTAIIMGFITAAMPTNRDAYIILGGYYATNYIVNSKEAKQLPDNILNAANSFLKEYAVGAGKQAVAETKAAIKEIKDATKAK